MHATESQLSLHRNTGIICHRLDLFTVGLLFHQIEAGTRQIVNVGDGKGMRFKRKQEHVSTLTYSPSYTIHPERMPGRNDLCPCGSGKKFKRCCFSKS